MSKTAEHTTEDGLGIIRDNEDKQVSYIAVTTFIYFLLDSGVEARHLSEALQHGCQSIEYAAESDEDSIKVRTPTSAVHAKLLVDNFLLANP